MVNHKKFMDIERIKEGITGGFEVGDEIVIQEKIDGANAAIRYDFETDAIVAQSRKNILNISNNLRGFYEWTQTLDKELVASGLGEDIVLFGEWLVPHTVKYPDEKYNQFYVYDAYNTKSEEYLPQCTVEAIADVLNLNYIPVFYRGEFQSWEHCYSFVGKTEMGGEYGEGIVVKNQTKLNDKNSRTPYYLKIVGEKFQEVHKDHKKVIDPEKLKANEENKALCETIVTEARVVKILHKLIDEGVLPENWGASEMPIVAKNLCKRVFEDCQKEEPETTAKIENFGKVANSICMTIARKFI